MWVFLSLISALCLGVYDIAKKRSLTSYALLDVLTLSVVLSLVLLLPELAWSRWHSDGVVNTLWYVPKVDLRTHGYIFLKSCIVLSSWAFSYVALSHLPLSYVSPMQSTRPMWTLLGALVLYGERLSVCRWIGVVCILGSIFLFSVWGQSHPRSAIKAQGRFYVCLAVGILLGSTSGLYDKYMMRHFDHNAVQVYYTMYQALIMVLVWLVTHRRNLLNTLREWRTRPFPWSIGAIAVFLVGSDFVYLLALADPSSLISVVSLIRRSGAIIPFLYGIVILREKNPWRKAVCALGLAIGLVLLVVNWN